MLNLSADLEVYFDPTEAAAACHDVTDKMLGVVIARRLQIMREKANLRRKMRACEDDTEYEEMKDKWEALKDEINDLREIAWGLQARLKAPV